MKKTETAITIGIPAYKRPGYTRAAVESCLDQDYSNYDILIQDDSPAGELDGLLEGLPRQRITYHRNPQGLGLARNANALLGKARGAWMLYLANDDRLEPGYLSAVNAVILKQPEASMVRTRYRLINANGQALRLDREAPFQENTLEFLSHLFLPPTRSPVMSISAVAFPTENFRKIGGFKDLHRGNHIDRLAWAELAEFGDIFCIPDALASIRIHPEQLSFTPESDYAAALSSNQAMEVYCKELLNRIAQRPDSKKDPGSLAPIRLAVQDYGRRHAQRVMDQGLCAAIEARKIRSFHDMRSALLYAQQHHVAFFTSLIFYLCLIFFPSRVRVPCLEAFKRYKFKRWFS